jgi:hypothetical protein
MSLFTLLSYLIGGRSAVLRIATTPRAGWLGGLFVLSAGFAREYGSHDLWSEPWHLVLPFGASLATSFLLFSLIFFVAVRRNVARRSFWSTYFPFLALYWMTAPLAWLYAIPVEHLLSAPQATAANLALLAIVSVWRVSLMTRVVSVYFGAGVWAAFCLVMLFADTVALTILYFTPLPIFNIMGGIPLTESEQMIQEAALWVGCLGVPTWFVWLLGVCIVWYGDKSWQAPQANVATEGRIDPSLWCLAGVMVLGWGLVLPFTQPEQRLRHDVESALAHDRIAEAIQTMSRHDQKDFPPHWVPPPRAAYRDPKPPLFDVLDVILDHGAAPWVRAAYLEKLDAALDKFSTGWRLDSEESKKLDQLSNILERLPEGQSLVDRHADGFSSAFTRADPAVKDRLRALLKTAGHDVE